MKRPNKEDYVMSLFLNKEELHKAYSRDLEKYCDDLEARLSNSDFNLQCLDKDILKLEKALDKACELLSLSMPYIPNNKCPRDIDCFNGGHLKNKEEWIATCMDDEEALNESWKPKIIRKSLKDD